ncbi:LysM peptidoglycan-binding domain-containing protein, partial [Ideonella sp. A 288]|uniref:LysM peptidoglycan-binding domain-containing protein n=1 Tax=Ideonella sp. A 288 TaxID=1962181 RepID=UPI001184B6FB
MQKMFQEVHAQGRSAPHGAGALVWLRNSAAALALVAFGATAQTPAAPTVVDVQPGDTFSGIATRFTGDPSKWRRLYHPKLSGLANPNLIAAGTQMELVTSPSGTQYLRVVTGHAGHAGHTAAAAAPAP